MEASGQSETSFSSSFDAPQRVPQRVNDAWSRLAQAGEIRAAQLRPLIGRSWKRSYEQGCNPIDMPLCELPGDETRALLRGEERLVEAAEAYLHAIDIALGNGRRAIMLGDDRSYVLSVVGDPQSMDGKERVPGPGALLSEQASGTNGMSAALAEGCPVKVYGSEHYLRRFQAFNCVGAPISGFDGSTAGVLCLAVTEQAQAERLESLVLCAAKAIESELIAHHLATSLELVQMHQSRRRAELIEELGRDLRKMHVAGKTQLLHASHALRCGEATEAGRMLRVTSDLVSRFSRRAELWREMALLGSDCEQRLLLRQELCDVLSLLTASDPKFISIPLRLECDPILEVLADRKRLRRMFMAHLTRIRSLLSGANATLVIAASSDAAAGKATVRLALAKNSALSDRKSLDQFEVALAPLL